MVEQPPSSTARELAEYLSRQFDRLATATNSLINGTYVLPEPLTVINLIVTGLATVKDLVVTGIAKFTVGTHSPPTLTIDSAGTRIVLYETISPTSANCALGVDNAGGTIWHSVPYLVDTNFFRWYGGTTLAAQLTSTGKFSTTGSILSSSPTGGIGYAAGSSGSVTQTPNKTSPVTLNTINGLIVTAADSIAAGGTAIFNLTNSNYTDKDIILFYVLTGDGNASIYVSARWISQGVAAVTLRNLTTGALAVNYQLKFIIIKGA
jgi:hypothetical protein